MNYIRKTAFGYSTKCNIKCGHCVAANADETHGKMEFSQAAGIINEMSAANVRADSVLYSTSILTPIFNRKRGIFFAYLSI